MLSNEWVRESVSAPNTNQSLLETLSPAGAFFPFMEV
jgi:hypothetical protein